MTPHGAWRTLASDSGRRMALLVVATGFLFNFFARGVVDTFMVFMLAFEAEFGWRRSTLTGIYSIYMIVIGLMGPVSGMLFDRWGARATYGVGLALMTLSIWALSASTALWQVYALIGGLCGVAASLLGMVPAVALIGRWFDRRMSLAVAMAYAGLGSGTFVIVPLTQSLIDAHGWRDTYALLALGCLAMLPLLLLPWRRLAQGKERPAAAVPSRMRAGSGWRIRNALRTREFWLLVQVFFFTACGVYSVLVQIVAYLVEQGYPPIRAALAFGASGMLSVVGVMLSGWLCARCGNRFAATLSFAGTLLGTLALAAYARVDSALLVLVYILAFGISQGARGPIVSTLTARLFANGAVASIFGAIFMSMSFGSAIGSWLSGYLHDVTGGYQAAFLFACGCFLVACAPFWLSRRLLAPQPLPPPSTGP